MICLDKDRWATSAPVGIALDAYCGKISEHPATVERYNITIHFIEITRR